MVTSKQDHWVKRYMYGQTYRAKSFLLLNVTRSNSLPHLIRCFWILFARWIRWLASVELHGCTAKKSCSCKNYLRQGDCAGHSVTRTEHVTTECIRKMGPVVNADASSIKDSMSQAWVNIGPGFELQTSDKEVISDQKWLNDKIISAWQFLLKRKFPKVGGLQPTVIVEKLDPTKDGMAQVLNCGNNHWVAMSTIGCGEGKVLWLDSFYGEPSTAKQKLIADTLKTEVDEITEHHECAKASRNSRLWAFCISICDSCSAWPQSDRAIFWSEKHEASPDRKSAKDGGIDVSGYKNTNEEKGHTETNYYSGLLYLPTPRIRWNGWVHRMPQVVSCGVCWFWTEF